MSKPARGERPTTSFKEYRDPVLPNVRESYLCENRTARDNLMKEICDANDNFIAAAMKSAESFKEVPHHTDEMKFKDNKAVVLYPASGFHIAPIAEISEELFKKHNLKEIEFVYTEVGGEPMLDSLRMALTWLIQKKDGWSAAESYRIESDLKSDGVIKANGGTFEHIFEINTPQGKIVVRFKNALSGEAYYLDDDLQRAHIIVFHDLAGAREVNYDQINQVLKQRHELENLLIIAENVRLRSTKEKNREAEELITTPVDIVRLPSPYGCSVNFYQERRPVIRDKKTRLKTRIGESNALKF